MGRNQRPFRSIRPTFFVFCEGESEETYVSYLRCKYRVPIEIRSKVSRNNINQSYINRVLKTFPKQPEDKLFLLYDLDVSDMLTKLQSFSNAILLVSNPCLELWYILHTCNHAAEATSEQCLQQPERICRTYRKGYISDRLKRELNTGEESACKRARRLNLFDNPSTSVYLLIENLQAAKIPG
jgi:hypothetical protein